MSKKIKVALIALLVVVLGAVGFMFSKVKSDKIAENVIVNGIIFVVFKNHLQKIK